MAKTKEELNELKKEFETLTNKLSELTQEELALVTGGNSTFVIPDGGKKNFEIYVYDSNSIKSF